MRLASSVALSLLFYLVSPSLAQTPGGGPSAVPTPRPIDPNAKVKVPTHWGGLFSVRIPATCKHPREMRGKQTCRAFLPFSDIPPLKPNRYRFRTWDEASEDDSSYRILLLSPSWRGIYVQGVCGHRVFVEVTYR